MKFFTIVLPGLAGLEEGNDIGIHKNRSEIVKFVAREEILEKQPELCTLLEKIKAIIRDSVGNAEITSTLRVQLPVQNPEQSPLWSDGMYHQPSKTEDSDEGTCQWIYSHPD